MLELGSSDLVVCEDCDFAELIVNVVDIVEEGNFRKLVDCSISVNTDLPCSRSFFIFPIMSHVPLESSSISTLRLSTIALTHVSCSSRAAKTALRYSLKSITISSSSLTLSEVVIVKIVCFSRQIIC